MREPKTNRPTSQQFEWIAPVQLEQLIDSVNSGSCKVQTEFANSVTVHLLQHLITSLLVFNELEVKPQVIPLTEYEQ